MSTPSYQSTSPGGVFDFRDAASSNTGLTTQDRPAYSSLTPGGVFDVGGDNVFQPDADSTSGGGGGNPVTSVVYDVTTELLTVTLENGTTFTTTIESNDIDTYIQSITGPVLTLDGDRYTATNADGTITIWTIDNTLYTDAQAQMALDISALGNTLTFTDAAGVVQMHTFTGGTEVFEAVATPSVATFDLYGTNNGQLISITTANELGNVTFGSIVSTDARIEVSDVGSGVYNIFIPSLQDAFDLPSAVTIPVTDDGDGTTIEVTIPVSVVDNTLRPFLSAAPSTINRAVGTQDPVATLFFREYPPTTAEATDGVAIALHNPVGTLVTTLQGTATSSSTSTSVTFDNLSTNFATDGTYSVRSTYVGQHTGQISPGSLIASQASINVFTGMFYGLTTTAFSSITDGDVLGATSTTSSVTSGTSFMLPDTLSNDDDNRLLVSVASPLTLREILGPGLSFSFTQTSNMVTLNGLQYNTYLSDGTINNGTTLRNITLEIV